jgi:hypothetical protein
LTDILTSQDANICQYGSIGGVLWAKMAAQLARFSDQAADLKGMMSVGSRLARVLIYTRQEAVH